MQTAVLSKSNNPIDVIEQKVVLFMEDELVAVRAADSEVYLFSLSRIMKR